MSTKSSAQIQGSQLERKLLFEQNKHRKMHFTLQCLLMLK